MKKESLYNWCIRNGKRFIIDEWDFENNLIKPTDISHGCTKIVNWICPIGHKYDAKVSDRTRGNNCPFCAGKRIKEGFNDLASRNPELLEEWDFEKNDILPTEIGCGNGTKAIWWKCKKGHSWQTKISHRTGVNKTGCPVCSNRIIVVGYNDLSTTNPYIASRWHPILNNRKASEFSAGSNYIAYWSCNKNSKHYFKASISAMVQAPEKCPVCANIQIIKGVNDLESTRPDLMKEWMYEKNAIDPSSVSYGNNTKVWWKCSRGHEWRATIGSRAGKTATGCPYCAGELAIQGENDLNTLNPKLAVEWDYEKNLKKPEDIKPYSNKSFWWLCSSGHSYKSTASDRSSGKGCPYCSGKRILSGFNDLLTLNPKLCQEWNYEKNSILPSAVGVGSDKKVWWICNKGHSWESVISSRNRGNGCPYCARQLQVSFPERVVYFYVKKAFSDTQANIKFDWLKKMEIDIYIPSIKIGIEYDGNRWHQDVNKDLLKDELCEKNGVKLIRLREKGCPIYDSPSCKIQTEVSKANVEYLVEPIEKIFNIIKQISNYNIIPDINIKRDYVTIFETVSQIELENSIELLYPDIVEEWNYEKNGSLNPKTVSWGSQKKVWWKCEKGHEWLAVIASRVKGRSCPVCANKVVLKGFNDLQSLRPDLASEWDQEKNLMKSSEVTLGSNKKAWWKCNKGHEWQAVINSRVRGNVCPYCSGLKVTPGENDLATKNPELLKEWDYEKNKEIEPTNITPGVDLKVWWKCEKGHSYKTQIRSKTVLKTQCPICYKLKRRGISPDQLYFPFMEE